MPDGKTHERATVVVAGVLLGSAWHFTGDPRLTAEVTLGTLAGFFLTPDLDVDGGCRSMYWVRRIGGEWASGVWKLFWWPYAQIPHRSFWSHFPVVSTALRVLYLALPVVAVCTFANVPFVWDWNTALPYLVGLSAADTLHMILDGGWH